MKYHILNFVLLEALVNENSKYDAPQIRNVQITVF